VVPIDASDCLAEGKIAVLSEKGRQGRKKVDPNSRRLIKLKKKAEREGRVATAVGDEVRMRFRMRFRMIELITIMRRRKRRLKICEGPHTLAHFIDFTDSSLMYVMDDSIPSHIYTRNGDLVTPLEMDTSRRYIGSGGG